MIQYMRDHIVESVAGNHPSPPLRIRHSPLQYTYGFATLRAYIFLVLRAKDVISYGGHVAHHNDDWNEQTSSAKCETMTCVVVVAMTTSWLFSAAAAAVADKSAATISLISLVVYCPRQTVFSARRFRQRYC